MRVNKVTKLSHVGRFIGVFTLFFTFFTFVAIVKAQNAIDTDPLFLWVRGDLWQFDPLTTSLPTQITMMGTISGPALSPDGTTIAFKAAAPIGLAALDQVQADGLIADFDLPADIHILNPAVGETRIIAGQPPDASLFVPGVPDRAIVRSTPVWSPDGTRLAWAEQDFAAGADLEARRPRLIVYDLAMNAITVSVTDERAIPVLSALVRVAWGRGGIMMWFTGAANETVLVVYDENGGLVARHLAPPPDASDTVEDVVWVELLDQSLPAILYGTGNWQVIPLIPNSPVDTDMPPQRVGARLPDISYALAFGVLDESGFFWEAFNPLAPDAASVAFPGAPSRVTLSPSGRAIAFLGYPEFGAAAIYREGADGQGEIIPIPGTGIDPDELSVGAVLWGASVWRITP